MNGAHGVEPLVVTAATQRRRRTKSSKQTRTRLQPSWALQQVLLWDRVKDKLSTKATGLSLEEQQKLCIARLLPTRASRAA